MRKQLTDEIEKMLNSKNNSAATYHSVNIDQEIKEAIQREKLVYRQDSQRSRVDELEQFIVSALKGRALPIQLSICEQILNVAGYAKAEARNAYHQSQYVREPARARLTALSIDIEEG